MRNNVFPPPEPGPDSLLREAVEYAIWVGENGGGKCPCCRRRVQVYKRTLNSSMAYGLITMHRIHGVEYGHAPSTGNLAQLGGELARLKVWGLLQESDVVRSDGGRAGWWKVTDAGVDFALNRSRQPKRAWIYSNEALRFDTNTVSIVEALGKKFNYSELMSSSPS
jgi:hypothetical protein